MVSCSRIEFNYAFLTVIESSAFLSTCNAIPLVQPRDSSTQDFHVRVAHDTKEATELVKAGFDYITGEYHDGGKILRKPMNLLPLTQGAIIGQEFICDACGKKKELRWLVGKCVRCGRLLCDTCAKSSGDVTYCAQHAEQR
jgi:hypothetical protein